MSDEITLFRTQAYRRKFYAGGATGATSLTGKTLTFRVRSVPADAIVLSFSSGDARFVVSNQTTNPGEFEIILAEADTTIAAGRYTYSIWDETSDVPVVPPTRFNVLAGGR